MQTPEVQPVPKARVVKAWINRAVKWRIYYCMELIATFDDEQWAERVAKLLNEET